MNTEPNFLLIIDCVENKSTLCYRLHKYQYFCPVVNCRPDRPMFHVVYSVVLTFG
jgi:hypothetical protein